MSVSDGLLGALAYAGANQQIIKPPNPALGLNYMLTPPGQYVYRVRSIRFTLTNTGTVAASNAGISLQDIDGSTLWAVNAGGTIGAGVGENIQYLLGVDSNVTSGFFPLPEFLLYPGSILTIGAAGNAGLEQVSNIAVVVHRLPYGDGGRGMTGLEPQEEGPR